MCRSWLPGALQLPRHVRALAAGRRLLAAPDLCTQCGVGQRAVNHARRWCTACHRLQTNELLRLPAACPCSSVHQPAPLSWLECALQEIDQQDLLVCVSLIWLTIMLGSPRSVQRWATGERTCGRSSLTLAAPGSAAADTKAQSCNTTGCDGAGQALTNDTSMLWSGFVKLITDGYFHRRWAW